MILPDMHPAGTGTRMRDRSGSPAIQVRYAPVNAGSGRGWRVTKRYLNQIRPPTEMSTTARVG